MPEWTAAFDKLWLPDVDADWEASSRKLHWEDMAWRVQNDTETVLLDRASWLRETTGAKNLCIAGGVGLNCVANGRIVREAGFDSVWIQPASGDDGIAIGCAYYGRLAIQKKPRSSVITHAYFGRAYGDDEVRGALSKGLPRLETNSRDSDDICAEAAKLLSEGNVLGWFQGRSEFGPRALGNRSILADPRTAEMKDKLNKRVKHRQAFRPFAPIVLAERAAEIFEGDEESPYMLVAKRVRPEWITRILPSFMSTARPACSSAQGHERAPVSAAAGVRRAHRRAALLNTSFNVKGEPIVETPRDAVACFLGTGIDYLVMRDRVVAKNAFHKAFSPLLGAYAEVSTMVRTGLNAD